MVGSRGGTLSQQAGKFCAHVDLQPRTPVPERENGAEIGPVSREKYYVW